MDYNNCGAKQVAIGMGPAKSADRAGLPVEMDGLDSDLSKLGALISDLRERLDNVMVGELPQPAGNLNPVEPPRSRCNIAEGVASFRNRVKSNTRSLQDVLDRLDL